MKKLFAIILSVAMLLAFAAACSTTADNKTPDVTETPPETDSFDGVYKDDTVILTAGGLEVTWDVFYYFLASSVHYIEAMSGTTIDWSSAESEAYKEEALTTALNDILMYKSLDYGAALNNAALTDENLAAIANERLAIEDQYGGSEAFAEEMALYNMTNNVYNYLMSSNHLYSNTFAALYGEGASSISDADVAEMNASEDWLMAKHILILTPTDGSDSTPMKDAADMVVGLIESFEGDDFDAYFDSLIAEYGEDPGMTANPEGYLFSAGDMVPEFEQETRDLEIGGVSAAAVRTDYGYHIIYRLPVNYDAIPISWSNQQYFSSLRMDVANMRFDGELSAWKDAMPVEYTDAYHAINFAALFPQDVGEN